MEEKPVKTFGELMVGEYSTGKKSELLPTKNTIETSFIETDSYIVEQIYAELADDAELSAQDQTSYLIYDKDTGKIEQSDKFVAKGKTYVPIQDELLGTPTLLLPSGVAEYGNTQKLVKEIKKFLLTYFELPPFFDSFLPYVVPFYWVSDKFPFVPYLHFIGRTSTGKTTAMEVLGSICYKPIDTSGAVTVSAIFRMAHKWRGTLLLDEFNMGGGEEYSSMLALLKSGVSDKAVLRTEGEKKREVKAYMVKSPKLFTSEDPIENAGMQSRTILIKMEKNRKLLPLYRLGQYHKDAQILRNKLLLWRFRHLTKIKLSEIEYGFPELQVFDRRVQQVITPIYYLSDKETKKQIFEFAKEQEEETLRERRESLDGAIFEIMLELYNNGGDASISAIHETLTKERIKQGYKSTLTERKIGSVIRKILGFETERKGHESLASVVLEGADEKITELCKYYGFDQTPSPTESSAHSASSADEPEMFENAELIES